MWILKHSHTDWIKLLTNLLMNLKNLLETLLEMTNSVRTLKKIWNNFLQHELTFLFQWVWLFGFNFMRMMLDTSIKRCLFLLFKYTSFIMRISRVITIFYHPMTRSEYGLNETRTYILKYNEFKLTYQVEIEVAIQAHHFYPLAFCWLLVSFLHQHHILDA